MFWRQMFPNPGDDASLKKAECIASAKHEYAYALVRASYEQLNTSEFSVPAEIVDSQVLTVLNNSCDITDVPVLSAIPNERWAISLTGTNCKRYIKSTASSKDMIDKENLPAPRYYIRGKQILFPDGVKDKTVEFTFASKGDELNEEMPISDDMAAMVRRGLMQIYNRKEPEDKTANQNPNF